MKALLCHPQTQHSKKLAEVLYANSCLYKFVNPARISEKTASKLPNFLRRRISSRIIDLPPEVIESNFPLELYRQLQQKIFKNNNSDFYTKYREIYQKSIKDRDILASDSVIGYDSSSWILAERVKKMGLPFILERTIGHHNYSTKVFKDALKMYPDWNKFYVNQIKDYHIKIENQEFEAADYIMVGSSFVKNTLLSNNVPEEKIIVNPYGVDLNSFNCSSDKNNDVVTFLFFGTVSVRKGVPTLLNAWKLINSKNARLILAGFGELPQDVELPSNVEFIGSIHPSKRNDLYNSADVFVFPSLLEGMAQVLVEAAACGLPIISTESSGAEEIIEEGINGFIIKPNDEKALAERIAYFIQNPDVAKKMGLAKLPFINEKFSLNAYAYRWTSFLSKL